MLLLCNIYASIRVECLVLRISDEFGLAFFPELFKFDLKLLVPRGLDLFVCWSCWVSDRYVVYVHVLHDTSIHVAFQVDTFAHNLSVLSYQYCAGTF